MTAYHEVQRFPWWMLLIVLGAVAIVPGIGFASNDPMPLGVWLVLTGVMFLIFLLFLNTKLEVVINAKGVHYRMPPFVPTGKRIGWELIESAEVVQYDALRDYGGWGLRYGLRGGEALNVRGNWGLQLKLKSGRRLLIGTSQPDAIREALAQYRP